MSATERAAPVKPSHLAADDRLARWPDSYAAAWFGLLETHKWLTRALDAELEAKHGLTLSALEVLSRLASAERHRLRLSALASACGLSLSRISRIVDALEKRDLVVRCAVESDARAVEGCLTRRGLELVRRSQATHFGSVQRLFFERLSETEIAQLAGILSRFAPSAGSVCADISP